MRALYTILAAMILVCLLSAASAQRKEYRKVAEVKRHAGSVTVLANDPRPLEQALCAVIKQYNWLVDYEDPPYMSDSELLDVTAPQWRASHPNAPGTRIPAGGAFEFKYDESPAIETAGGEEAVLQKLVSAYNRSGNPGKFVVRAEGSDLRPWSTTHVRYAITGASIKNQAGQDQSVTSILDTPISIPTEQRSADETIAVILEELSRVSGTKVHPPGRANNLLIQSQVTVGGEKIPARTLLLQAFSPTVNPSLVWRLLYDANSSTYVLNVGIIRGFCN